MFFGSFSFTLKLWPGSLTDGSGTSLTVTATVNVTLRCGFPLSVACTCREYELATSVQHTRGAQVAGEGAELEGAAAVALGDGVS